MKKFKRSDEIITIEETPSGNWWIYFTANGYKEPYNRCGPFPSEEAAVETTYRIRRGAKKV